MKNYLTIKENWHHRANSFGIVGAIVLTSIILLFQSCAFPIQKHGPYERIISVELSYDKPYLQTASHEEYDNNGNFTQKNKNTRAADGWNITAVHETFVYDLFGYQLTDHGKPHRRDTVRYRSKEKPRGRFGYNKHSNLKENQWQAYTTSYVSESSQNLNADKVKQSPDGLYLRMGLGFVQKGGIDKTEVDETKTRLNYVQVPVIGVYKYSIKSGRLHAGFGPYLAYGIGGKTKTTANGRTTSVEKSFSDDHFKRFDAGLNFLAGYELNSGPSVHLAYVPGLFNIGRDEKVKNRSISLNVSYPVSKILPHKKSRKEQESRTSVL